MANSNGQGLMELADLISRREYNWALCRGRVYVEELVRGYAQDSNTEYTTLSETIEALYRGRVLSERSRENLHSIRVLGNKAVHENDDDPQDAKKTYYLLKEELQTSQERQNRNAERTPVRIDAPYQEDGCSQERRASADETGEIDMSYSQGRRSSQGTQRQGSQRSTQYKKKKKKKQGIDLYTVLRILIPVIIIVLLIILLKSIFGGSKDNKETETPAIETEMSETEAPETEAPETEAPETEAPETEAQVSYKIKGQGVRIRYADNPGQIYTQLDSGVEIGAVSDFMENPEYADFARFTYDGKDVIVSKQFIEPVQ